MPDALFHALQFCNQLDRTLANDPDDDTRERLEQVGELLGGLSIYGFVHDLTAKLDRIEDDFLADAGLEDYVPGAGPHGYISDRLCNEIDRACHSAALEFVEAAERIMGVVGEAVG